MANLTHRYRIVAIVVPLIFACATGRAEILSTNLSGTVSGYSVVNDLIPQRAQAFQTTVSNTITEVKVNLSMNSPGSQLGIYTDDANKPGSLVATIASGTYVLASPTDNNVFSGLSISLVPWTKYWVVFSTSSGYWGYNLDAVGEGPGYLSENVLFTSGSWALDDNEPYRMEIQAVPEPAGLVLAAIPLVLGTWAVGRRRAAALARRDRSRTG